MAASPRSRVIRTSNKSKASLYLTDTSATLAGDENHFVTADDTGIYLKGPISIVTDGAGVRTGGLFVGINEFLNMIPSTIVSPIPQKVPFPPVFAVQNLVQDLSFFLSLLV